MTYQLYHGITMVQVDAGDSIFYIDPAFLFFRDGKEIPISEAINGLKAADVCENFTLGGYTLTMIWIDGAVSFDNFQTLGSIAYHLWFLGAADNATPPPDILPLYAEWYRGYFEYPYGDYNMEIAAKAALEAARTHQEPTEPAEAAPAAQVTDDTPTATTAAQAAVDGAMGLLKEDVSDLLDEDSPLRIAFHIAQRVFGVDAPQITLADLDKVAELLTTSDRLTADAESTGKSIRRGKTKSAAEAAAAEARAAANIMARFLFADEDLELADFYSSNFTAWCSLGPWLRLYQQLILLRRSINGGNLGTLTLTRNQDTGNPFLKHPDGRTFSVADIPGYTTYIFDANDTTISAALSSGYRIRIDDRYATDDELRDRLLFGVSAAAGDYNYGLMYYLNDFENDWAPSTCDDVIAIAATATPDDLLSLFLVYNFGHWRNDPHSDYEIDDVVRDMAGRLRGASVAPAEAAQDAAENVLDDTAKQYIANHIRPRARRVVDMCDKCIRLRKENNHRDADSELTDIINTAKLLRLDAAGWIPMDEWGAINRRAAAATDGGGDPRYWWMLIPYPGAHMLRQHAQGSR